jgi:glucokinase
MKVEQRTYNGASNHRGASGEDNRSLMAEARIDDPEDFCAGVDVGGTKISSALFTKTGGILGKTKVPIARSGGEQAADQVAETMAGLAKTAARVGGRMLAVGISIPGIVYSATGKVWAPNIPGWDRFPLRAWLEKRGSEGGHERGFERGQESKVRVPIILESDRSAYVTGEAWQGAAAGAADAVFLAVGSGIGAGILAGGRVIHGHEDIAGAVGWFGLNPEFKTVYGEMGCFEAEASGNSVGRKAREVLGSGRSSVMIELARGRIEDVTAETVAEAARMKDPLALQVVDDVVRYLAMGIANIVSILNPEVIVLGGGLFQASDIFPDLVRREFRRWAQPLAARDVRIELSALGEDAGLYGCGKLAWDSLG